jgi:hypothetical protein
VLRRLVVHGGQGDVAVLDETPQGRGSVQEATMLRCYRQVREACPEEISDRLCFRPVLVGAAADVAAQVVRLQPVAIG